MRYWTRLEIGEGAKLSNKMGRIYDAVHEVIEDHGWPGVSIVRIGRSDHDNDFNRFEVDIELAPGVTLPTYQGSHEGVAQGWEDKDLDVGSIVDSVVEGLEACRDLVAPIGDTLHDLRRRARTVIAGWQRKGLPASLVEVRLAPYDHWRGDTIPKVLILFEGLDEDLRRTVEVVHLEVFSELEQALEFYRPPLSERNAGRIALAVDGASGTIDQLAINAISRFHDVEDFLRLYAEGSRHWLPDTTAVHMTAGHVSAGTGVSTGQVDWHGDSMTFVKTTFLSDAQLAEAVGKPAMALFEHPYLSPEILVASTEVSSENGLQYVTVVFTMPSMLFCSATGRVWGDAASDTAPSTVLPFRKRAS